MPSKSIGGLHATVTANAEQFVSEFKRADRESQNHASQIEGTVDGLVKRLEHKFSARHFGYDILQGLGIGSGMAVAEKISEKIVDHYKEAAEAAKSISDSIERQLEATRRLIALNQTQPQQLGTLQAQMADMEKQRAELLGRHTTQEFKGGIGLDAFTLVDSKRFFREANDEEKKQAAELAAKMEELGIKIREMQIKIAEANKKAADAQALLTQKGVDYAAVKEITADQEAAAAGELAKFNEELNTSAEKYRSLGDPMHQYQMDLEEVARLQRLDKLTAQEAADARWAINRKMDEVTLARVKGKGPDYGAIKDIGDASAEELKVIEKNSYEIDRIVGNTADNITNAFIDAASGSSDAWRNLADTIIRELLRIAIQIEVIKPLLNGLGDAIGSTGFWGSLGSALSSYGSATKALGGDVEAGVTYRVNESGEEFFRSGTGGTIIPAGISRSMAEGQKKGDVLVNVTNHIGSGVTRQELASVIPGIIKTAQAAVADAVQRGGGYRKAFT